MDHKIFDKLIASTGMVHWRMPVDHSRSLENRLLQKNISNKLSLWDGTDLSCWSQKGLGHIELTSHHTESVSCSVLKLEAPARTDEWPEGCPDDGDYCAFGDLQASIHPTQHDWQAFNRLHFQIYPNCPGMHSPMIALQLYNDGTQKIPDKYAREGYHTIHLKNHEWNDCIWEFPCLPRDVVTALTFEVHSYGQELSMENCIAFSLKDLFLEQTDEPEPTLGWSCKENTAVFSTEGYWTNGSKTAVAGMKTDTFHVCQADSGENIYTGTPLPLHNEKGSFYIWDFSQVTAEGHYRIKAGDFISEPFAITSHPLYESIWKVINFLYCERCGGPVGGGHGTCHGDILARHNGLTLAYCGGWHDAGDVSQQTLQTAEVVYSLLEIAVHIKDEEPTLYYRIMEEAAWGLDFVLRMRFGDGYRATSAGIRRWSNGFIGDMDDCCARVHNHSFENFLMSGVEAYAAQMFRELDPELSSKSYTAACEDYHWAQERFALKGMELPSFFEHTYHSSLSQYWAAASWSASLIYAFLQDDFYGNCAVEYASKMLSCQETGKSGCPMPGFFYREPDRKTIVHFNHQAREQIFVQALEALCLTQPAHAQKAGWEASMQLFGAYLKQIYSYAAPYGMLPAGLHKMDEYLDRDTFPLLHLMTEYEDEKENYKEQLENGMPVNSDYCVRQFPVWFSFRGNTAIHLSAGKAASVLGRYFNDVSLTEIAREQLYWTFGKNPFGQSLVYGAGSNYAQQYGALNGEMAGSIPVGIETRGNDDIPFWPIENNATYKEVWTTSAGKWLQLAADLY